MNRQGYILIGLGEKYVEEAAMCAKSIKKFDSRPINVLVLPEHIELAKSKEVFDDITEFKAVSKFYKYCQPGFEQYGTYPKINLIHYCRYTENIFVDTDVICQYNPDELWKFANSRQEPVMMMGTKEDHHWHWGFIDEVSAKFGKPVPHIHGGFLYFRKTAFEFFEFCDMIAYRYDELGCKRMFRGGMCDEIIFALAHSHFNYSPIEFDDHPIMTFNYDEEIKLPSKLQTHNNKELKDYIPFVHMYDRDKIESFFKRVMKL